MAGAAVSVLPSLRAGRAGLLAALDRARRNRYVFAALLGNIGVWTLTALVLTVMPRSYVTEWSLILPASDPDAQVNMADIGQAYATNRATYDSKALDPRVNYRAVLTSSTVIARAAERVGLPPEAFGASKIKLLDQSSIIQLTTTGGSAEQSEAKAKALFAAFSERLDELRANEGVERDRGIEASIRTSREKLEAAQTNLVDFKVSAKVVSARQLEEAVARIGGLETRLLELSGEAARLQAQLARLSASLGVSPTDAGRIVTLQADAQFVTLLGKYATAGAELAEYGSRWDEGHPRVMSASGRHDSTAEALNARARTLLGARLTPAQLRRLALAGSDRSQEPLIREMVSLHAQHVATQAELAAVRQAHATARTTLDPLARDSSQLDDLQRRLQFSEAVFNSALGKIDVGRANIFSSYPLVQLLEEPRAPKRRDKRPLLFALAGATACSLLLSMALTLAWLRKKGGTQ